MAGLLFFCFFFYKRSFLSLNYPASRPTASITQPIKYHINWKERQKGRKEEAHPQPTFCFACFLKDRSAPSSQPGAWEARTPSPSVGRMLLLLLASWLFLPTAHVSGPAGGPAGQARGAAAQLAHEALACHPALLGWMGEARLWGEPAGSAWSHTSTSAEHLGQCPWKAMQKQVSL